MSNYLSIKRIYAIEPRSEKVGAMLETISEMMDDPNLGIEWGGIYNNNWGDRYPYAPKVEFWAAHNDTALFLKYRVEEEVVMAAVEKDGGEVWTDSCVEFFISFDDTGYYNFEFSCIGKKLLGFRQSRDNAVSAPKEILDRIKCKSTLGTKCFAERKMEGKWEIMIAIPMEAFFAHKLQSLEGVYAKANAYKCGDNLSKPHFLSWNPIKTENPNFHVPEYFGRMRFM